jgi:hypothetical protein
VMHFVRRRLYGYRSGTCRLCHRKVQQRILPHVA